MCGHNDPTRWGVRVLSPLGGRVETTENASQAHQGEPIVAGEDQISQDDHDHADDEQCDHQHRDPRLGRLHVARDGRCVPRRRMDALDVLFGVGESLLARPGALGGRTTATCLALRRCHESRV